MANRTFDPPREVAAQPFSRRDTPYAPVEELAREIRENMNMPPRNLEQAVNAALEPGELTTDPYVKMAQGTHDLTFAMMHDVAEYLAKRLDSDVYKVALALNEWQKSVLDPPPANEEPPPTAPT